LSGDRTLLQQRSVKRPDIQGLRAIAVGMVVVYHFFPGRLSGGFVGVDVFFVISGFLISLHLFKEMDRGGIRLAAFYARRARRLLPAAATVLVVTGVGAALIYGPLQLMTSLQDMAWASVSLANYHFAQATTGYFAIGQPSPFLHFWSLSVEEQYYLIWPLLLVIAAFLGRGKRSILGILAVAFVVSLVLSVVLTNAGSPSAYYSLATRAWELAIGGGLAYGSHYVKFIPPTVLTVAAAIIGTLAIIWAALRFSSATPFPGSLALVPTLGSALVIWAGTHNPSNPVSRLLSIRPATFVGNISYSLYLWHWPVLVLATAVIGVISLPQRLALILLSFGFAIASFYLIERPTSRFKRLAPSHRIIAVGLVVALITGATPALVSAAIPTTGGGADSATFTAPAVTLVNLNHSLSLRVNELGPGAVPSVVPSNVNPTLSALSDDLAPVFTNGCYAASLVVCAGGDPHGSRTIVLAGDSHAGQWWPAVNLAAKAHGWKLYMVGKDGCPLAEVAITQGATATAWPECSKWQQAATKAIISLKPDLVIYDNHAAGYRSKQSLRVDFAKKWSDGVDATLAKLRKVSRVLFMGQTPMLKADPGTCLLDNLKNVAACSTPVKVAIPSDIRALDEHLAQVNKAIYFDPSEMLCSAECPMETSNIIMYRDSVHLDATFSALLANTFSSAIAAALKTPL
jgi:peptidoglycan/LPS O-acetylase OafA/YrhL